MNSFVLDMFHRICKQASIVQKYAHKVALTAREIQTAVKLVFAEDFANNIIADVSKSFAIAIEPNSNSNKNSNLVFSSNKLATSLKKHRYAKRLGKDALVYLSATLQFLVCQLLDSAVALVEKQHKQRIEPRHIMLAVHDDDDLSSLMDMVCVPFAGVKPDSTGGNQEDARP
eukprot:CAMPEP_0202703546 /NCGR_PEP_ID=MMETSP1385-20130828/16382_1 /ASSEMBLY_ACC=CAM_ASM_000861 /TAXON_ID=933848 /ORGANISM="Elphidium margaritaceum" /LENGTH=171 /DNA_ID=CAMNT_0049361419 /DNA_START=102 /DNA_END=617 /DNA_ORIENTATION=+